MPRNRQKPKLKLKTHRGAAKRFKITANGKVLRRHSGKRHLMGTKKPKRMRQLKKIGPGGSLRTSSTSRGCCRTASRGDFLSCQAARYPPRRACRPTVPSKLMGPPAPGPELSRDRGAHSQHAVETFGGSCRAVLFALRQRGKPRAKRSSADRRSRRALSTQENMSWPESSAEPSAGPAARSIWRRTKGFFLTKSKLYQSAQEAANRADRYAYRDRRNRKRQYRRLVDPAHRRGRAPERAFLQPVDARAESRGRGDRPQDAGRSRGAGRQRVCADRRAGQGGAGRQRPDESRVHRFVAEMTNATDSTRQTLAALGVASAEAVTERFRGVCATEFDREAADAAARQILRRRCAIPGWAVSPACSRASPTTG